MKNHPIPALALCAMVLLSACGRQPKPLPPEEARAARDFLEAQAPNGLPACPDLLSIQETAGTQTTGSATLHSGRTPDALLEFYTSSLACQGWVLNTSVKQGKEQHLFFRQGDGFLRIQIGPAKPGARIELIWGRMSGSDPVRESYEPEFEPQPEEDDGGGRGW